MTAYAKPLPQPDSTSEEFWRGTNRGQLLIQLCKICGERSFYPREVCPRCLSDDVVWTETSGRGTVYTYTVVRQAAHPGFNDDVPYVLVIVQLDEGPRVTSNLVDCRPEDVRVDMPVCAVFERVAPELSLVKFKPLGGWQRRINRAERTD